MKCPGCGSDNVYNNGTGRGKQQYKCRNCGKFFRAPFNGTGVTKSISKPNKTKMGISTEEFRKKHDVVYILSQVFNSMLADDMLYEKSDIIKMSGLSPGYPGISTVLDSESFKKYRGRAGSVDYWAKVKLIETLKNEGIMR